MQSPDDPVNKRPLEYILQVPATALANHWRRRGAPDPESGGNQHAGISAPPAVLPSPEAEVQSADDLMSDELKSMIFK
jgi:hypothetical protein